MHMTVGDFGEIDRFLGIGQSKRGAPMDGVLVAFSARVCNNRPPRQVAKCATWRGLGRACPDALCQGRCVPTFWAHGSLGRAAKV
jgi:hypothetical protein